MSTCDQKQISSFSGLNPRVPLHLGCLQDQFHIEWLHDFLVSLCRCEIPRTLARGFLYKEVEKIATLISSLTRWTFVLTRAAIITPLRVIIHARDHETFSARPSFLKSRARFQIFVFPKMLKAAPQIVHICLHPLLCSHSYAVLFKYNLTKLVTFMVWLF